MVKKKEDKATIGQGRVTVITNAKEHYGEYLPIPTFISRKMEVSTSEIKPKSMSARVVAVITQIRSLFGKS